VRAMIEPGKVFASAVVTAPPDEVFALLANPHRHHEFDGSGSVQSTISGPQRLALGDSFGVKMKIGLPYRITNHVVELEEDRRIAWCHWARAVWRYELEAVPEGTRVTETFDYGVSRFPKGIEMLKFPQGNAKSIRDTLLRLQQIFGNPATD
jgi:uncharacterized protein YndB with AHSA1/START domain